MRARACRGNRGGSDNRLRRAWSFVEESAALGCGDGIVSSAYCCFFRDGFGFCEDVADKASSSWDASPSFCAAAVLWYRACILRLYCGMLRCIFFAAAYGHDGRRGSGFASNCEAHLATDIRFIKEEKRTGRETEYEGRGRAQQQLDEVVCASAVKSRLPELFCQAFSSTSRLAPHLMGDFTTSSPNYSPTIPHIHSQPWAEEARSRTYSSPMIHVTPY